MSIQQLKSSFLTPIKNIAFPENDSSNRAKKKKKTMEPEIINFENAVIIR